MYSQKQLISSVFLFNGMDFEQIDAEYSVCSSSRCESYGDTQIIMAAGDKARHMGILAQGKAYISPGANDRSLLSTVTPGRVFGAAALFSGTYDTTVRAKGNCTVIFIPIDTVRAIIFGEAASAENYIKFLSGRVSFLNKKIAAYTAGSAEAKLAVYLLGLDYSQGPAEIPVSLSTLASTLNIGRASLYRAMDSLEHAGIIRRNSKSVTLLQPDRLEMLI